MAKAPPKSDARQRKRLYIAIGSDCDPDRVTYGGAPYNCYGDLKWEGVRQGVPKASNIVRQIADEHSVPIRLTWCVRADDQMRRVYGDHAWAYKAFAELWEGLAEAGDEIAWHPHLWRWGDQAKCWYQEIQDKEWMTECLEKGYEALRAMIGERLQTCRMGWEFHNNHTMRTVAYLGIHNDFSAIPGWFTAGEASLGSSFHCYADWRETPDEPYKPSEANYQRPAFDGESSLSIHEFPMSTFSSTFWSGFRTIKRAVRKYGPKGFFQALCPRTWTQARIKAYATISPAVFNRLLSATLQKIQQYSSPYGLLVTAFHPDELLEDGEGKLYSSQNFRANLRSIIDKTREQGVEPVFVRVSEVGNMNIAECF